MRHRSAIQLIVSLAILVGLLAGCSSTAPGGGSTAGGAASDNGAAAAPETTIAVSGAFALFPLMSVRSKAAMARVNAETVTPSP